MVKTINMQDMRYLNLFLKVTKIQTRYCFIYNETLMFCIPKSKIQKAIGKNNSNLKKMSDIVKKRIRIIPMPNDEESVESFIKAIISPIQFKSIEITDDEVIVTAGSQNKAALLGRNKRRLSEMQKIISDFFNKSYKII